MKKKKLSLLLVIALGVFFANNGSVKALENYVLDSAPDTFTTNGIMEMAPSNLASGDAVIANDTVAQHGNNVIDYHTKELKKVFCYDRKVKYASSKVYTKTTESVDYPIVYIISHAAEYYKKLDSTGVSELYQQYEMSWMTQIAIWQYQNADNFAAINQLTPSLHPEAETDGQNTIYSSRADKLWNTAISLVNAAKASSNPDTSIKLDVNYSNEYSIDENNKTVQTSLITVNKTDIKSYKLDISKAPNGTKVYAEGGNEITDLSNVIVEKFYLVFPIDNTENYTYDFNLGISTDTYKYYKGYKYVNTEGYQPLVLVAPTNKTVNADLKLSGSHVNDTASSIANSIYFVGFLILITGMGIIYANVKTKKEQN